MKIPLKYNVRNLFVRRTTTIMTVASIAFVVLVYIGVLALASGLKAAFAGGDPRNVLVLRDGTPSEFESFFGQETRHRVAGVAGVAPEGGGALVSAQLFTVQIFERNDGTETNVSLRGVEPAIFSIRPQIRLIEGRNFVPGRREVIVGKTLARRFNTLQLGQEVELGRQRFRIVGVFAGGGNFTSEVWGAVEDFADAYRRNGFSSVLLQARTPAQAQEIMAQLRSDESLRVEPQLETDYLAEQARRGSQQFAVLGNILAWSMAFGACFAAANTMYAQVSSRASEIGTLRALGFRRRTILLVFLIEAALLGLFAGLVGALIALPLNGLTAGTTNSVTYSEIGFRLQTSPEVLLGGILLAVLTGLAGGLPAAISAARQPIAQLLRET